MNFTNTLQCDESVEELLDKCDGILQAATAEDREITSEEGRSIDSIMEKVESIKSTRRVLAEREAEVGQRVARRFDSEQNNREPQSLTHRDGVAPILSKGDRATAVDGFKPVCENQFGHYVLGKVFGPSRATPGEIRNALSESEGVGGGFTVPGQLFGEIIDLARARSVLMDAGTRVAMMDGPTLDVPKLNSDASVSNVGENTSITASDMVFERRQLNAYKAAALVKVSRELWEDSPTLLAQQIDNFLAMKMGQMVDYWGIQGTGSNQPIGLVNSSDISSTGSVGAIAWTDVSGAVTSIRNSNHEPNSILLYPEIHDDLFLSTTGDGTNAASMWKGPPPTLDGKNYLPSTNVPSANAIVGDFSLYLMGVRTGATVEVSSEAGTAFADHQVWVKITMRYDFVTLDDSAFHLLAGITT